jgi:hypothetical protein
MDRSGEIVEKWDVEKQTRLSVAMPVVLGNTMTHENTNIPFYTSKHSLKIGKERGCHGNNGR